MNRLRAAARLLALAATVITIAALARAPATALANSSSFARPGGTVTLTGPTFQQVTSSTIQTTVEGLITAHGSVQASLTGDNQWDTAACYLALDGASPAQSWKMGPLVENDLTTQWVTSEMTSGGAPRDRPTEVRTRDLRLVGFASPVAPGAHTVRLMCAVSRGPDGVSFQDPGIYVLTEPAAGMGPGGGVTLTGPTWRTVARTSIRTTAKGPLVAFGTVTASIPGGDKTAQLDCDVFQSYVWPRNPALSDSQRKTVKLTTQAVGYNNGGTLAFRDANVQRATLGLTSHTPDAEAGENTYQLRCAVFDSMDAVSIAEAGLVVVAPTGPVDAGDTVVSVSLTSNNPVYVVTTTLRITAPSRIVAFGSIGASVTGPDQVATPSCRLLVIGSASEDIRRAAITSQRTYHAANQIQAHVAERAVLHPMLMSDVLRPENYSIALQCAAGGNGAVNLLEPGVIAFAISEPPPPPAPPGPPGPLTTCGAVPATTATYVSDPTTAATQTGGVTNRTILVKDLKGHAGYGQYGSGADILYAGQAATWTFTLPASIDPASVKSVTARVALVADDSASNMSSYSLKVWTKGDCRFDGPAGLPHGAPVGGPFTNWVVREYPVTPGGTTYTVTIANAAGNRLFWYAVDWIELVITTG